MINFYIGDTYYNLTMFALLNNYKYNNLIMGSILAQKYEAVYPALKVYII